MGTMKTGEHLCCVRVAGNSLIPAYVRGQRGQPHVASSSNFSRETGNRGFCVKSLNDDN